MTFVLVLIKLSKNFSRQHFEIFFLRTQVFFLRKLTLLLLNTTCPVLANSVDPDQLASEEAN